MALKALMVDVDGVVVIAPHPSGWSAGLEADLGLAPSLLQSAFFAPNWDDIVHGRAALRDRLTPVMAEIAPQLTAEAVIDYWLAADSRLDHALLADLDAVRARGVALHLATVQEHERARYLWETVGLSRHFDAMHYSADLGAVKPHDAFFAAIEARTGLAPEDLLFIDDKVENVEAARRRGWPSAVWTGRDTLAAVMARAVTPAAE